jgi:hypothetical protein
MKIGVVFLSILFFAFFTGCVNMRYSAIPRVENVGCSVKTKFTYRLVGYKVKGKNVEFADIKKAFEEIYPSVFSDNGLPIVIDESKVRNFESAYGWTAVLSLFSVFTLPIVTEEKKDVEFEVAVLLSDNPTEKYDIQFGKAEAATIFSPIGCFFWNGAPESNGCQCFSKTVLNEGVNDSHRVEVNRMAIAYGAAVRLKELEDIGLIDPAKLKRKTAEVNQSNEVHDKIVISHKMQVKEHPIDKQRPIQMIEIENISL